MPYLLKRLLFRLHWLAGISAGLVLAVVGVTGALIGLREPLLELANPQWHIQVPASATPLPPDHLLGIARRAHPDLTARSLQWQGDDAPVAVRMAPAGHRRGGESVRIDPYSGRVLGPTHGERVFHVAEDLHRRLAAGEVGKQLVGASTALLILMALTGLVLRWPKHVASLRAWLRLDTRLRGRSLLWHLHAVLGTWALLFYLTAALTGLWWSYDIYRNTLNGLAGVSGPLRPRGPPPRPAGAPPVAVDIAWRSFREHVPEATRASLDVSGARTVQIRYRTPASPHERAWDTLTVDASSGRIVKREDYVDLPRGRRFIGALYPLHSGSFFGRPGLYLMSLASLLMPVFTVTGLWLWLQRRRMEKRAHRARAAGATEVPRLAGEGVLIAHASQSGTAERLAWCTADWLRAAGARPQVLPLGALDPARLSGCSHALFVVASYGDGGPPDSALPFVRRRMQATGGPDLSHLSVAVLALGNRRYEAFCGFGLRIARWLQTHGARLLFPTIELHEAEAAAIARWRAALDAHWPGASGDAQPAGGDAEAFADWRLRARQRLNPGDPTAPLYAIELEPSAGDLPAWQPGDLLDVYLQPSPAIVETWLSHWRVPGTATVQLDGRRLPLARALREREPPRDIQALAGLDAQALVERLPPLAARSYSIASLPGDGRVRLMLRVRGDTAGSSGLVGRTLATDTPTGEAVPARVRACPHFHAPDPGIPLLLIGNGVGIAPFLGMLAQRAAAVARGPAWLIYGERRGEHDAHTLPALRAHREAGVLARLDVCFSRDGGGYVQDVLHAQPGPLGDWVARGAAILVCGSPQMGEGVHAALQAQLGAAAVDALLASGRYRRELF